MTIIKARAFGVLCETAGRISYACAVLGPWMERAEHWAALRKRQSQ